MLAVPSSRTARKRMSPRARREAVEGYIFILPWLVGLVAFVVGPIIASFYLSFTDYQIVKPPTFTGLANYQRLAGDDLFWQALKVTAIYVVVTTPLQLCLSFAVALLMNQKVRLLGLWRTIYYIPNLVPTIAVAMLWLWVLNPQFGLLNTLLRYVGIQGPLWLSSSRWALISLIIMSLWSAVGAPMLIYLAGLQGISSDLYEAVACDGGGGWAKFRYITVPMMTPVIFFNLVMSMIASFQIFSGPYLVTGGGPANATLFYVLYIYQNAFQYFQMGYASALAWVLFVIILAVTVLVLRWSNMWVYYEGERAR